MITPKRLNKLLKTNATVRSNGFASVVVQGQTVRGLALPGKRYWFEYHCYEGHDSSDAQLWYRSHQQVTVIGISPDGEGAIYGRFADRCSAGMQMVYSVRFDDGHIGTVFEDELLTSRKQFERPDPPAPRTLAKTPVEISQSA